MHFRRVKPGQGGLINKKYQEEVAEKNVKHDPNAAQKLIDKRNKALKKKQESKKTKSEKDTE